MTDYGVKHNCEDTLVSPDIRSSEKVLYRQVLDLYATSVDYDPKSRDSVKLIRQLSRSLRRMIPIKIRM